jgi:hypothetical protein
LGACAPPEVYQSFHTGNADFSAKVGGIAVMVLQFFRNWISL